MNLQIMAKHISKMKPKRIQRKRKKGWRMPPNTIYVGRPTKWGNPILGDDAEELFRRWLSPEGYLQWDTFAQIAVGRLKYTLCPNGREKLLSEISELEGKNLACWCALDKPCHADVLLELANG